MLLLTTSCKDDCKDVQCINGSCDEGFCNCFPGFTGNECETRICDTLVCMNDGECVNGVCECPEGFTGLNCETNLACQGLTCDNGGTCNTTTATCDCLPGYSGDFCENVLTPTNLRITAVRIDDFPATNNGLGWDASDGPDIYFSINTGTAPDNTEFTTNSTMNATPGTAFTITDGFPLDITDIDSTRVFALYDDDAPDADEYMEALSGKLSNLQLGFPAEIRLYNAMDTLLEFDVTLMVEWSF